MAKFVNDTCMDQALLWIQDHVQRLSVCSSVPANINEAQTTGACMFAMSTILTTASFSIGNGDVSGRKITIAQVATMAVNATGIADTIVLFSTGASGQIYAYTTCSTQVLGSTANAVTVPAWDIEIADPTP